MMSKILALCAASLFIAFSSFAMDEPFPDNQEELRIHFSGLIPQEPDRQAFNGLASKDCVVMVTPSAMGSQRRESCFYLKGFESGNDIRNAKLKAEFQENMPGAAVQSYKKTLTFEGLGIHDGWLELKYSYVPSRWDTWGFSTADKKYLEVKTAIPHNYPHDVQNTLDFDSFIDSFEQVSSTVSDEVAEFLFAQSFGSKLSDPEQKQLLIKYSGLIPTELYRTAFNGFQFEDVVVLTVADRLSAQPKARRLAFRVYGDQEGREYFVKNIKPSSTSLVANFSYLDLLSIAEDKGCLVLEFGFYESSKAILQGRAPGYFKFKIYTQIPHNYPHEVLAYMPQEMVPQKVNQPISEGILAGLNARDLGKIFGDHYQGLIIRSQYLGEAGEAVEKVKSYIKDVGPHELKTVMNLNIHGFGGGHMSENYSMAEIEKCQSLGLTCLHPYSSNSKLRAYVDGEDPRTIPLVAKDRGNVFNPGTVKYFISDENRQKLGIKYDEMANAYGFGEDQVTPAVLEGNVVDLLTSIRNFLHAGLPGVFHCKGGIHRTGQVEAIFMLLFAMKEKSLAMWCNAEPENLNNVWNYRVRGYLSDCLNYAVGRSDKGFMDVAFSPIYQNRKVTPVEYNYILSSQGMPRTENIDFIRDFGHFARIFAGLSHAGTLDDDYAEFQRHGITWVSKEIFVLWHDLIREFNTALDGLVIAGK